MSKYKHEIEKVFFYSRWSIPSYSRNGDWTIIGISKLWFDPLNYEYSINLFGFSLRIWIKRILN